jgi:16S rRNA (guanine(966)-N(2))-methyltransferase RsmD
VVKPAAPGAGPPQAVRIIGGQWRRHRLPVADRPGLRPTPDRVRETLFNWLGQQLEGWRCLDAFAGSGALGLEAASRGAARVLLVERDPALARALAGTVAALGAGATVAVEAGDGLEVLRRQAAATWDLLFLDPPWGSALLGPALEAAARAVAPGGFVYAEDGAPLAAWPEALEPHRSLRAGAVHAHLLRKPAGPGAA